MPLQSSLSVSLFRARARVCALRVCVYACARVIDLQAMALERINVGVGYRFRILANIILPRR